MLRYFKNIMHPERMHDIKDKNYFEGWYFKNVSSDFKSTICFILGICINDNDSHCFIQIIENINNKAYYFRYDKEDFEYSDKPFYIKIKNNVFSFDKISIDIKDKIKGEIKLGEFTKLNNSIIYPNIMGPFLYLRNECYHDIISMNHPLNGSITLDNKEFNLDSGKGYIEKDFGTSFPNKYLWLQSNHPINKNNDNFFLSIANIPFLKTNFTGLISILSIDNKVYRFATYNFSKIKKISKTDNIHLIEIKKRDYLLCIKVIQGESKQLISPNKGKMDGVITESLDSLLEIQLYKKKELIYENTFLSSATEFYNY